MPVRFSFPRRWHVKASTALIFLGSIVSASLCAIPWQGGTLLQWLSAARSGIILYQAHTTDRVVALTFDDGPDPRFTPRMLDILHRYGVKATFFQQSRHVEANPELAYAVSAAGHVIGNHTVTHPYLERASPTVVRREIEECERTFETKLHLRSYLFRPPRGHWTPVICREAQRQNDHIILWTVAVEHHEVSTPNQMADRALRLIGPGAIVLMHDGGNVSRETTVQALPLLLQGLKARGYRCLTVPEMLHIRGDEPIEAGKQ